MLLRTGEAGYKVRQLFLASLHLITTLYMLSNASTEKQLHFKQENNYKNELKCF